MSEKATHEELLEAVKSNHDPMDPQAHQFNLEVVASQQISLNEVGTDLTNEQKFIILRKLGYDGLTSLDDLPLNASFMIEKIQNIKESEVIDILTQTLSDCKYDPNFPSEDYRLIEELLSYANNSEGNNVKSSLEDALKDKQDPAVVAEKHLELDSHYGSSLEAVEPNLNEVFDWKFQSKMEAALIEYYSPYPEVRAVTNCYDDPTMYCETPRVYLVGLVWCVLATFVNQFFSERQPSISLSGSMVQLFIYPCGLFLAAVVPKWKFKIWNYEFDLNPGPWNAKEQLLATLFYSVSGGTIYVSWNIHVQKMEMFYNNDWIDFGYETLLALSTCFMGFGFAGIMRKFAVYPVKSVWPTLLPTLALNRALMIPDKKQVINGWKISRYNFFFLFVIIAFFYFWLPNYLMDFLHHFNWMTWIKPENRTLAEITGSIGGLGLNPIPSFDWNMFGGSGALELPFFSNAWSYVGMIISFFVITGVYYTNHL